MTGIKKRWVRNYILIIFISLIIIEGVYITSVYKYYYGNIAQNLINRATVSSGFYNKYLNTRSDFETVAKDIIEDFSYGNYAEVQILDTKGNVLMSSSGFVLSNEVNTGDYLNALKGEIITWRGKNILTDEKVMAVSSPLKYGTMNIIGVLRYVTSLEEADSHIQNLIVMSIVVVGIIIIIMLILSMIFSKSIIDPIKEITKVAKKMAKKEYSVKIDKQYDDEIGELADTLNYMAGEILKSEELKNEFISSISHELRTPLTSIKGWGETILTGGLEDKEETERGLRIILRETSRLTEMVEELLDFSRLEGGRLILNLEKVNVKDELEDIIHIFKSRVAKNGLSLKYSCKSNGAQIKGDKNRLRQVFINILDNAVKFSKEGMGILVELNADDNNVCIQIEDHGIGIQKEEISKVKEKFYKGNNRNSGSGLGLAISNEIIELHGGSLTIESEINNGTKVLIILPRLVTRLEIE